ncbi:MAG: U32 family peptidase, partial [Candidatus Cloacimonetes bacterium]|nr:U32 family peptidase [Candidatus Cloacimonadota bacterium]
MEILSPAGNLEKVKFAILYGADAVYAGSQDFSLRAKADNFTQEDLTEAVAFCHKHNKKLFVPLNIYA